MEDPTLRHGEIFFQFEDLVEDVRNLLISTFLDKPSLVLLALTSNKYHGLIKPSFENFDFSEAANDFGAMIGSSGSMPLLHYFLFEAKWTMLFCREGQFSEDSKFEETVVLEALKNGRTDFIRDFRIRLYGTDFEFTYPKDFSPPPLDSTPETSLDLTTADLDEDIKPETNPRFFKGISKDSALYSLGLSNNEELLAYFTDIIKEGLVIFDSDFISLAKGFARAGNLSVLQRMLNDQPYAKSLKEDNRFRLRCAIALYEEAVFGGQSHILDFLEEKNFIAFTPDPNPPDRKGPYDIRSSNGTLYIQETSLCLLKPTPLTDTSRIAISIPYFDRKGINVTTREIVDLAFEYKVAEILTYLENRHKFISTQISDQRLGAGIIDFIEDGRLDFAKHLIELRTSVCACRIELLAAILEKCSSLIWGRKFAKMKREVFSLLDAITISLPALRPSSPEPTKVSIEKFFSTGVPPLPSEEWQSLFLICEQASLKGGSVPTGLLALAICGDTNFDRVSSMLKLAYQDPAADATDQISDLIGLAFLYRKFVDMSPLLDLLRPFGGRLAEYHLSIAIYNWARGRYAESEVEEVYKWTLAELGELEPDRWNRMSTLLRADHIGWLFSHNQHVDSNAYLTISIPLYNRSNVAAYRDELVTKADCLLLNGVTFAEDTLTTIVQKYFEQAKNIQTELNLSKIANVSEYLLEAIKVLRSKGAPWNAQTFAAVINHLDFFKKEERKVWEYFCVEKCPVGPEVQIGFQRFATSFYRRDSKERVKRAQEFLMSHGVPAEFVQYDRDMASFISYRY